MERLSRNLPAYGALVLVAACLSGCEETLEACAPCGVVSEGDSAISGDPRLDGVLESVARHAAFGARAASDFDRQVDALAHAVGYLHEEGEDGLLVSTSDDVSLIASLLRGILFEQAGESTTVELRMPRCAVGASLALARQKICEGAAGCYVDSVCDGALGSCAGLCVGSCDREVVDGGAANCGGDCFVDVETASGACLDECIGACAMSDAGVCAGRCRGVCDAPCSAYAADGDCDGACAGTCAGTCVGNAPLPCAGTCAGSCRVAMDAAGCAGACRGDCADGVCDGTCLGQFRPEGCDAPARCDGVLECQETSKDLAWAYMGCEPGVARVHVELGAQFTGDPLETLRVASVLEEALTLFLRDYGALSLLVDGVDPSGEVVAQDMLEPIDTGARPHAVTDPDDLNEAGVPVERASFPLSALRARVSVLRGEAGGGGYKIAVGAMPCVVPALEDAFTVLDGLVPIEDRDTSAASAADWPAPVIDRTRGLFRVLDGEASLLAIDGAPR